VGFQTGFRVEKRGYLTWIGVGSVMKDRQTRGGHVFTMLEASVLDGIDWEYSLQAVMFTEVSKLVFIKKII
jgi:hypothetical protein